MEKLKLSRVVVAEKIKSIDVRKRKAALLLGATLFSGVTAGCATSQSQSPEGSNGTDIKVVTLEDGTKCATMDGTGKSIDCDWGNPTSAQPDQSPEGSNGTDIKVVTLEDGTKCATMDGTGKSIDCDWGNEAAH